MRDRLPDNCGDWADSLSVLTIKAENQRRWSTSTLMSGEGSMVRRRDTLLTRSAQVESLDLRCAVVVSIGTADRGDGRVSGGEEWTRERYRRWTATMRQKHSHLPRLLLQWALRLFHLGGWSASPSLNVRAGERLEMGTMRKETNAPPTPVYLCQSCPEASAVGYDSACLLGSCSD